MLGFLLASFGFVEFFYILLERSQEIHQHLVFLLGPIIRSMTVVDIDDLASIIEPKQRRNKRQRNKQEVEANVKNEANLPKRLQLEVKEREEET